LPNPKVHRSDQTDVTHNQTRPHRSLGLQALLKHAAELAGRTLADFVVAAERSAAKRCIEQAHIIRVSAEDQRAFVAAVLRPPAPALRRAFTRRGKLIQPDN
jgi:uncharacterized protein (DUF1778 family)